jgi:glycerophosphoryl diester phosphodiesterase
MWRYPKILAHRGGGTLAPENTMAGVRCGMAHGFRAIEFDVMLSRDLIPVVMHDPYLGRTVAGSGNVFDYGWLELARMDAGSWFGRQFAGEPVPVFIPFAKFCKAHGVWMNVELKPAPGFDVETGGIVAYIVSELFGEELDAGDLARVPLLSSFSVEALAAAREVAPAIPRALLVKELAPGWEGQARALGVQAIHVNHKTLTQAQAQAVKQAGYGLFCYTVNDPGRARELLGWGVDALCTDRIDLVGPDFSA